MIGTMYFHAFDMGSTSNLTTNNADFHRAKQKRVFTIGQHCMSLEIYAHDDTSILRNSFMGECLLACYTSDTDPISYQTIVSDTYIDTFRRAHVP